MKSVGLDPSTKTGYSLVTPSAISGKVITFPAEKGYKRVQLIARAVQEHVEEANPDIIVVEGFAFNNRFTLVTLVELGACIRLELHRMGRQWLEVPPTSLKLWATGKGNSKKPQMAEAAKAKWGFESKSDDIIDAFLLAQIGLIFLSQGLHSCPKGTTLET